MNEVLDATNRTSLRQTPDTNLLFPCVIIDVRKNIRFTKKTNLYFMNSAKTTRKD